MRGKEAKYNYNTKGVELNVIYNTIDTHLTYKNKQTSVLATTKKSIDTLFYYTEGVKLLITPNFIRGKVAICSAQLQRS